MIPKVGTVFRYRGSPDLEMIVYISKTEVLSFLSRWGGYGYIVTPISLFQNVEEITIVTL